MPKTSVGVITNPEGAHLGAYFEALSKIVEVESVVLADATWGTFEQASRVLGDKLKKTYPDARMMLGESAPLMTLISLEASLAPPAIAAALDAGSHVFAEKPSCLRAADFAPLVQQADSKHLHLMLAFANRLNSPVAEARRLMQAGTFGKVYGVEMHIVADQTRLKNPAYHQQWFAIKQRAGGGHLIWLGIHWLDLLTFITGLKVREVSGLTSVVGGQPIDVEDSAAVIMRFDNGSLGTLTSGYYLDKGYHTHIKIWCEHGWLELSGMENGPLEYYSTKAGREAKVERFEPAKVESGYTPFVRAAYRACVGLEPAPVTGQECLQVLRTVFASYRAAETGMRQTT